MLIIFLDHTLSHFLLDRPVLHLMFQSIVISFWKMMKGSILASFLIRFQAGSEMDLIISLVSLSKMMKVNGMCMCSCLSIELLIDLLLTKTVNPMKNVL